MMDSGTTVSAELGLMLIVPQHTAIPLMATVSYSGDDPYAVRMAFHVGADEPVEWIFAGISSRQAWPPPLARAMSAPGRRRPGRAAPRRW